MAGIIHLKNSMRNSSFYMDCFCQIFNVFDWGAFFAEVKFCLFRFQICNVPLIQWVESHELETLCSNIKWFLESVSDDGYLICANLNICLRVPIKGMLPC